MADHAGGEAHTNQGQHPSLSLDGRGIIRNRYRNQRGGLNDRGRGGVQPRYGGRSVYRRLAQDENRTPRHVPTSNMNNGDGSETGGIRSGSGGGDNDSQPSQELLSSLDTSSHTNVPTQIYPQTMRNQSRHSNKSHRGRGRGGGGSYGPRRHILKEDHDTSSVNFRKESQSPDQNNLRPRGRTINNQIYNLYATTSGENTEEHSKNNASPDIVSNIQSEIAECQLKSNDFECMICCDNIRRSNPIWYCNNCYNIFHLKCAVEWCNKSIKSRNEAIAQAQYPSLSLATTGRSNNLTARVAPSNEGYSDYQSERLNSIEWPCPTCREVLYTKPDKYKCFCGKVVRPELNKHLTPHSCGQLCGRKRPEVNCPHSCNTICHPGRCTPCPLTSRRPCFCGKLIRDIKCSVDSSSCGEICQKPLDCGRHSCSQICHDGPCGSCDEMLKISCKCGQEQVEKSCRTASKPGKKTIDPFSCDKICDKLLDCGKHYCNEKCHPGPKCPSCKLLNENIKTCPCGSTMMKLSQLEKREFCTDPVPTCDNKCNSALICGPEKNRHRCKKKCHAGMCPPCKLKTPAQCECKQSTKTVECQLMFQRIDDREQAQFKQVVYSFTCETRCNKLKNCGRHRCNIKCCKLANVPGSTVHRCNQICNKKLPCGQHFCQELCHPAQCGDCTNIGWEELTCHCGSSVLYPPIPCGARPPACRRPCRRAHSCGHPVKHECHDESEKCAPCTVFVKRSCFCGSDSKDSVYCYLLGYSCGRTCKKQLACKRHTCRRVCHDNECETPDERGVIICTQPCSIPRFSCRHPCGIACHGAAPCPSSECKKTIEITCECGNKTERIDCHRAMRDIDNSNKVAMLSTNRSNQDTIIIDLSKKSSPKISDESSWKTKKLDCDESCLLLKRNKALAEALDIAEPDLKPANIFGEDPLRLLKEAVAQDYKFVASAYSSLVKFMKTAQESDKRFIFMQFAPANKLKREVVHELAHHFNCSSESRDEEPFRHVVVRAYKNKSCAPDFNIEQLLPIIE